MQKNDATGWYANVSKDKNGQPEALNLGVVTIRAGSARFVEHRLVERSHNAFELAKKAGRLHGPLASETEAQKLLGISAPAPAAAPPPASPADDLPLVAPAEDPPAPAADDTPPPAAPAEDVSLSSGEGAPVSDDTPPASSPSSGKPKKLGRR